MSSDSPGFASREALRAERKRLKREYRALFDEVSAILFRWDPIGINGGVNTDEYDPEAATIVGRLREARSVEDVERIVREELVRWFGEPSITSARAKRVLKPLAEEIWHVRQRPADGSN